ncbi:UNKNOWN [Stylonychia lemnae]|uniref:Cyclic nucleotide-binding domain-containing protein n=1 Tax=Stylonychia lemnae TaxID=5949 RepID=A0A078B6I5_STYLE|nr:UNKNOWN [Stylonychia lemnae]|eukprot:CDW88887.1 UNKNOWN [Stylonychia lemnae]
MEETLCKRLVDIRDQLKLKIKFSDDDLHVSFKLTNKIQQIKIALKDIFEFKPELRSIPTALRNELSQHVEFVDLRENQVLIWPDDHTPRVYFIFKGAAKRSRYGPKEYDQEDLDRENLDLISYSEQFKVYKAFSIFGSIKTLQTLSQNVNVKYQYKEWEACYRQDNQQLQTDVMLCIDQKIMSKISTNKQKAFAEVFTEKIFSKGSFVLNEGQKITHLYLVKEGECKILSSKVPIIQKFNRGSQNQLFQKDLLQNKSYFSKTTSTFQLGLISQKEWIGDEIKFFNDRPIPYSVIATKPLKVFCLSKEDFYSKMPKDLMPYFDDQAHNKVKWLEKRFYEIAKSLNKLKDNYFETLNEQSNEVQRQYPQARSHALHTIRNRQASQGDQNRLDYEKQKTLSGSASLANISPPKQTFRVQPTIEFNQTDLFALSSIVGGTVRAGHQLFNMKKDPTMIYGQPQYPENSTNEFNNRGVESVLKGNKQFQQPADKIKVDDNSSITMLDDKQDANAKKMRQAQSMTNFFENRNKRLNQQNNNGSLLFQEIQVQRQQLRQTQGNFQTISKNLSVVKANHLVHQLLLPKQTQQKLQSQHTIQTENDTLSVSQSQIVSPSGGSKNVQIFFPSPKNTMSPVNAGYNPTQQSINQTYLYNQNNSNQFGNQSINLIDQGNNLSRQNIKHNKHLLLFCSTPNNQRLLSQQATPLRQMANASTFNPLKYQLIPKISQKFETIRQKVKPQSIFTMKQDGIREKSNQKMNDLKDEVQQKNETFFVVDKKIQLLSGRQQERRITSKKQSLDTYGQEINIH